MSCFYFSYGSSILVELEFGNVGFVEGGISKPLEQAGIEPEPHWWKACVLTIVSSPLPQNRRHCPICKFCTFTSVTTIKNPFSLGHQGMYEIELKNSKEKTTLAERSGSIPLDVLSGPGWGELSEVIALLFVLTQYYCL